MMPPVVVADAQKKRWSRVVVLGGAGLVGRTLLERLRPHAGSVLAVDRRSTVDLAGGPHGAESSELRRLDITDPGTLRTLFTAVRPQLVVNAVNLATIYSQRGHPGYDGLIRYHADLFEALSACAEPVTYLQIGTTGSGGLGFDIPFTHGGPIEDMPIIHKAAFAGMVSQLLVMIARSFPRDRVRVAEVKPGLAIFEERVQSEAHGGLRVVTVDGGESGVYTRDEIALLTRYMGYTTVGRLVDKVMAVLAREPAPTSAAGHDMTAAIDAAVIAEGPEERRLRDELLVDMERLAEGAPVLPATGNLGPPAITRDLTLAAALLAGEGPHGPLVTDAFDYIRATRPGVAAWLATQDLDSALRALEAHVAGTEPRASWIIVHRALEARPS